MEFSRMSFLIVCEVTRVLMKSMDFEIRPGFES